MNKQAILDHLDIRALYKEAIPSLTGDPQASGRCPFHDDQRPSFSVNLDTGHFHCHGCGKKGDVFTFYQKLKGVDFKTALKELARIAGVSEKVVMKEKAVYRYTDEEGKELYQVVRYEPKDFRPRRTGADGSWIYDIQGVRRVPYNLLELINANEAVIVEGEKDADTLKVLGYTGTTAVTTSCGGAKGWRPEYSDYFLGKQVAIIPDNDRPGLEYAETIARSLNGKACVIKIVKLPALGERTEKHGHDVSDWIELKRKEGRTEREIKTELAGLIKESPAWEPKPLQQKEPSGPVMLDTPEQEKKESSLWPKTDEAIFCGLAGEIVKAIEPHTEADPTALLIQALAAFGSVIGRGAYFEVEADRHHPNIFAVLVGETSKGRKGTSWGHIKSIYKTVAPDWDEERIQAGLSSGEGLMWAVRDPITKKEPIKMKGKVTEYQDVIDDEGVADKRLFIIEPEFASVLKVASRDGNTLSAVIRQAWDSGKLRTMTKNTPCTATDAHITLIAHVTKEELIRYLTTTEAANGFANRFLWLCVKRSKCLPRGGRIQSVNFEPILKKLSIAIEFGKGAGKINPTEETWTLWEKVYPNLSDGRPGMLGAVTSRAEAQVMRLSMLYALLDSSSLIQPRHLIAGLALWDYAFSSARYIFGDSVGNQTAEEIINALKTRPRGLSRTEIYNFFGRHKKSVEISQALGLLLSRGMVAKEEVQTEGRTTEVWTAQ